MGGYGEYGDYDSSWTFYMILIIVIVIAKFLIVVCVCCVHQTRKRQRVVFQRRVLVQGSQAQGTGVANQNGYDQNTVSSSEFQPAFTPGPNGILGVYPPPYSEQSPKPPPYTPSSVYPAPNHQEEAMAPVEDPRVDIPQTDGLVTKI